MPANEKFLRKLSTMHVVFAVSAVTLLGATVWMMAEDHTGSWRDYQRTSFDIQAARTRQSLAEVEDESYQQRVAELKAEIDRAQADVKERDDELREVRGQLAALDLQVERQTARVRGVREERDVARANYDLGVRDKLSQSELQRRFKIFEDWQRTVEEAERLLQDNEAARAEARERLRAKTAVVDERQDELKRLQSDSEQLQIALFKIDPDNWFSRGKRKMMEWPIIDGFNSHIRIQQDWLPDLPITLGMTATARFDRCRTCHLHIDRSEAGEKPAFPHGRTDSDDIYNWIVSNSYPHPYSSHPRLDVYLSPSSPHPVSTFGCTICHEGQGSGTNFSNAAHAPNDPHQYKEWQAKYDFKENHYWEYPMLPERFRESSCLKCHHDVVELGVNPTYGATAPQAFKGWELINSYGCFGCHEFRGYEGDQRIGPDLRLEPNFFAAALELQADPGLKRAINGGDGREGDESPAAGNGEASQKADPAAILRLAQTVADAPEETASARNQLRNLILADKESGKPILSPRSHMLAEALKDEDVPGDLRKVGPSLRHVAHKTSKAWIEYWTEQPKRFRPETRMPQFFDLSNQHDEMAKRLKPVELEGISHYLMDKSQDMDLLAPQEGYQPNAERGEMLFSEKGCLACHSHAKFPNIAEDFGPELTTVFAKVKRNADDPNFSDWLYTWIRDPQRYHPRSRMPNLYLEPEGQGDEHIDPAADIAAFLLQSGSVSDTHKANPDEYTALDASDAVLDDLVKLYLSKAITRAGVERTFQQRNYPLPAEQIKGDEIELVRADGADRPDDAEWRRMKLNYVGRRTISQYGCFGCHDVPGFEGARPIGTTLQDWGRKDPETLALEHIEEYLHEHGEPDGSATHDRAVALLKDSLAGNIREEERAGKLGPAYFYDSLLHHGRAGFLYQKLRDPRSYDYRKIETKGYDERLRMPEFGFTDEEIEAIATFVLGMVAEPPPEQYIYNPPPADRDRLAGEKLLQKYNCGSCHVIDLPRVKYGAELDSIVATQLTPGDHPEAHELLLQLKPPRNALTDETGEFEEFGEKKTLPLVEFRGLLSSRPDPEFDIEDQEYGFDLWETIEIDGKQLLPASKMNVPVTRIVEMQPARGGRFAEWLVEHLMQTQRDTGRNLAWQASPPPLYEEGMKVQTPWLYQFLRNPTQLRHTTVLRMPRFNMSRDEARTLANYFAAADGSVYPYQEIEQRERQYIEQRQQETDNPHYLADSWKLFNAPLCVKCHSMGGREYEGTDPRQDIRGPNLDLTANRLRPEWLQLWLFKPQWITPYTSMPANFPRGQSQLHELFDGDPKQQTIAIRDALMNYHRLMESQGRTVYPPDHEPDQPAEEQAAEEQAAEEQAAEEQTGVE